MKEKYLYARKYGNEPTDLKLLFIYFVRNSRYVIYSIIAGCLIFALGYYLANFVLVKEHEYVATGELYLEYVKDIKLDNIYINDYTWQNLVHTDKVTDFVMEHISFSTTKDELKSQVTANLVSDVRFVTLNVTTNNPERSVELAQAFQEAIILLSDEMADIERIVVFSNADSAQMIEGDNRTIRMAVTGAVIGGVLSTFAILFFYTLDDAIYLPITFERRFGIPVIGVFHNGTAKELKDLVTAEISGEEKNGHNRMSIQIAKLNLKKSCEGCMDIAVTDISVTPKADTPFELLLHLKLLNEQDEMTDIARGDLEENKACFTAANFRMDPKVSFEEDPNVVTECAKYDGTILLVRAGEHNTKVIERALNFMHKQGCNIVGALLYDADAWILKFYYYTPINIFGRKKPVEVSMTQESEEEVDMT